MENKKGKKKVLLYYLILAACLLVIAAVTVTVVLTVGRNKAPVSDGQQTEKPNDGNKPDDGTDKPDDGKKPDDGTDKPTNTDNKYRLPLDQSDMTCGYEFAYDKTLDRYAVHQGIDFDGEVGAKVYAALDGTVTKIVSDDKLGENYVTIKHKDGMTATYKYIDVKEGLKEGATVKKGDVIGSIAEATGMEMSQGAHLHFEMTADGKKTVNPDAYLDIVEK